MPHVSLHPMVLGLLGVTAPPVPPLQLSIFEKINIVILPNCELHYPNLSQNINKVLNDYYMNIKNQSSPKEEKELQTSHKSNFFQLLPSVFITPRKMCCCKPDLSSGCETPPGKKSNTTEHVK